MSKNEIIQKLINDNTELKKLYLKKIDILDEMIKGANQQKDDIREKLAEVNKVLKDLQNKID